MERVREVLLGVAVAGMAVCTVLSGRAAAASLEVFHADSLAGPMKALKQAFEAAHPDLTIALTSGVSKQLAERIQQGARCDVFAPSSPAVVDELMLQPIAGSGAKAASWYVVFSANEMVVITRRGNPLGIARIADLAKPGVRFARVTGEKDLATSRTIEFLTKAAALEGVPAAVQTIVAAAPADPASPTTVPDTVRAVTEGKADAGVVYYSAAVAAQGDLEIIRFPASVNVSDKIRNAATVPGTAQNAPAALTFIQFLLSPAGQNILKDTGQPPVVPPILKGDVPAALR
jgi:molybdate transport system substrate-binding protein